MLQIIAVGKNPKKKEISKRLWRIRQGKSEAKVRGDTYEDAKERAAQIGFKKPSSIVLIENPKRKKRMTVKRKAKAKRKRKVICAKKNPPGIARPARMTRKRHETIIVGYSTYPGPDYNKPKRWFYDGVGFTRKKEKAMRFAGDGAKAEAKRIQYQLPREIYAIRVETV